MQHHNDTINKQTQENFFRKICTSHFIIRVRKGLLRVLLWEGVGDRTELKYFDPHSYGRQRCVFLFLLMLNRRPWGPLCWVLAFFTASYQQLLWSPNSIGVPEGPLGRVWLSLPHLVYNSVSNCNWNCNFPGPQLIRAPMAPSAWCGFTYHTSSIPYSNSNWNSNLTELFIVQCPLDLWNRLFNRHPAEITVMQFTGYSPLVHQSMSVAWEFFLARPISSANFRPRDFLS